jgi:hypothetical protein
MKTTIAIIFVALICGCKPTAPATAPIQKWEYKVVVIENIEHYLHNASVGQEHLRMSDASAGDFNLDINAPISFTDQLYNLNIQKLGQEGWELVSAVPQTETNPDAETGENWGIDSQGKAGFLNYRKFSNTRTGAIILIFKRPVK